MIKVKSEKIYNEFWEFAYKRQEIFYNKLHGIEPITTDPILKAYKFCNAYRVLDRVSQYLVSNVIYCDEKYSKEDTIFRIVLFKIFNLPSTWEYLQEKLGIIKLKTFDFDTYSKLLNELKLSCPIYNNAYISCANKAFGYDKKHDNHLKLIEQMFLKDNLALNLINAKNMEEAFNLLIKYPLIGKFMAYQLVTDINYSDAVNWTENEFTVAGPGAERGIKKVFDTYPSYVNVIKYCFKRQTEEFKRLNLNFKYIKNHELQLIDIQNLFCEFDKYCREFHPELKSNRTKIKSKYKANSTTIKFMLPPKWNAEII